MYIGFFIIGFIIGYVVGMTGGVSIAKRNEPKPLRRESKRSEPVVYPARFLRKDEPLPDYYESVPSSWRDDLK